MKKAAAKRMALPSEEGAEPLSRKRGALPPRGEEIRSRRLALGWSIGDLATRAGVGRATVHEIEHGKRRAPREGTIRKIMKALGGAKSPPVRTTGRLLRAIRESAGLSVVNTAELFQCAPSTIFNYENDYSAVPRPLFERLVRHVHTEPERIASCMGGYDLCPRLRDRSGRKVRKLREKLGFRSARAFAEALGVSPSLISLTENGLRPCSAALSERIRELEKRMDEWDSPLEGRKKS